MANFPVNLNENCIGKELLNSIDYVITDCDGVLWLNNEIVPNANETIKKLRKHGKKIIFATNNSSKSRNDILQKFNKLGFEVNLDEIMLPSYALTVYLKKINFTGKIYVFGCSGIEEELNIAGIKNTGCGRDILPETSEVVPKIAVDNDVNAIVVGYDKEISIPKLIKACTYAHRVPDGQFIATNIDETFPTPDKNVVIPGTGAFVNFIQTAAGRKPIVLGKPEKFFFDCIKAVKPDIDPSRTVMIGDRLNTDIAFGKNNGFRYQILVQTGVDSLTNIQECFAKGEASMLPSHYMQTFTDLDKFI